MEKCKARELLKSNNLKATNQRVLLLEEIINNQDLFTANSLFTIVSDSMDLVTVYRVLTKFSEEGIIREIFGQGDSKTYELSCIHNPVHPHFSCKVCGKIYCIKAVDKTIIQKLEESCNDFLVDEISMQFTGICKNCR